MVWRNVWNLQLCQAAIPPSTAASRQMGLTPTDRQPQEWVCSMGVDAFF